MDPVTILAALSGSLPSFLFGYFGEKATDAYLSNETSFSEELQDVIQETIVEFSDVDTKNYGRRTPFYHSAAILEELLKFRLMSPSDYDQASLFAALQAEEYVQVPSPLELSAFLALFTGKLSGKAELKKLEIGENFQEEIFRISGRLADLGAKIEMMAQIYNGELELQWRDRIDAYLRTMGEFRPATALSLLEALESSISSGTRSPGVNFLAGLEFQKGQCLGFLGRGEESYRAKIRAYTMLPSNVKFAKVAAICYYRMGDLASSKKIALELLEKDPFCAVGWAYKVLTSEESFEQVISEVPQLIRQDRGFLRHINLEVPTELRSRLPELGLVPDPIVYEIVPVTTENYAEAVFWMNLAISAALYNYFLDFFSARVDERPIIRKLGAMLEAFLSKLDGSEVPQDYPKLKFLYAFTLFSQDPSADSALAMENALGQIQVKDWFFVAQAANALQLTGHTERAVLALEKHADLPTEGLLLLVYCYKKLNNDSAYLEAVKRFAASVIDFPEQLLLMYLNLVLELKLTGLLEGFGKEDFLQGKVFADASTGEIVERFVTMIFEGTTAETTAFFHNLADVHADEKFVGVIGSGFFAVEAYEEALPLLARSYDPQSDSRELYQYIVAQQKTGKDLFGLLRLLKNWRENFPFVGEFLRTEAFMRRDLVEWEEVCAICELYLGRIKEDSAMLAIYLNALHHISNADAVAKIGGLAASLGEYKFTVAQNAAIICDILIIHGHYEEAFELIYPFASDPREIQVRGNYNSFVLRLPQDISGTPLKEFSVVKAGHFVKYEHNGLVGYVEMDERNLAHRVYGQFLGKLVGDEVKANRGLVHVEDVFVVRRIMNKYLSVYDEILHQSETDPYAGLPFQTMKFDPDHPGGILKFFEEMFGGSQKVRMEDRDKDFKAYYANELSLTELIYSEYKDDFIQGYYNLVEYHRGISAAPLVYFEKREMDVSTPLVIDMSSLLLLHQISKFHSASYTSKFIISRYIVDQLKSKLSALELRVDPFDSPVHEWGRTTIGDESLSFRKDRVLLLRDLLEWIKVNCTISLSDRTIEIIRGAHINVGTSAVIDAAVSTALLVQDVQGRVLITDDLFYIKTGILGGAEITSTEDYVKRLDGHEAMLEEFVRNRVINFAPSAGQLVQEFAKGLSGQYSRYELLLENSSLMLSVANLQTVMDFIKELLLNPVFTNQQLKKHITHVFTVVMRTTPGSLFFGVRQSLLLRTYLLGDKQDLALAAFDDARTIIEQTWVE